MSDIDQSLQIVRDRITRSCARAGRREGEVTLVGAAKGVPPERLRQALSAGLNQFGENYIQEARAKIAEIGKGPVWHMIGHVQSNKVKYIPGLFSWVHSVDRRDVLEALEKQGAEINVLFEVNLSGEASKHGTGEEDLNRLVERAAELTFARPRGLMTMPPFDVDPEASRPLFARLRRLKDRLNERFSLDMKELSMGMSSDFEVAIEEGATMIRVGTAIFGERS